MPDDSPAEPAPIAVAAPPAMEAPPRSNAAAFSVEPAPTNGHHDAHGDDEPDPADVRRHIAAARRNMDPDHQIRRAMDAFLSSPTSSRADREQGS